MTDKSKSSEQTPADPESIVQKVREKYGEIAEQKGSCCAPSTGSSCCAPAEKQSELLGYSAEDLAALPEGADLGLGCGAPVHHLKLQPGETVLDLGSGAGVDVFIAAHQVGDEGKAIGVDMTPQMLERARANAAKGRFKNVEFLHGRLEELPVDDASVDAVTSNCVINLVPDKTKVFAEVARVLKPGGRLVISDIVLDGELPEGVKEDLLAYVGCVSGAEKRQDYFSKLEAEGLIVTEVLSDTDVVKVGDETAPEQVEKFAGRSGVTVDELKGKVKSVTFRAVKK
ncbi:MAG: arsenite methyltransferase [Candidatus Latescibacterota bacterium]|jgi:SAM-dependent methyltransferase